MAEEAPGDRRVEVMEAGEEWLVRVVEDDQELTRSFALQSFALAFAEGQRIRLGLADFKRIEAPSDARAAI
ncbi:hypothetical protein GCM10007881_02570 [Mesorhizobium huakuii]|uniref:hypothetical protein n=1 Tax=Mesorhizobium TaxID=68287 RepID=UPI001F0ABB5D|nr:MULTISPECIES: hypothetical protein [Mesorhizobium]MCH4561159.1 hypothetical protein [Mesorhizobium jarvisii]GLQ76742.1 hypothetical protein GCM10007881_02570 [Mesorhizobium huakuii]